jgi:hypothetical protein
MDLTKTELEIVTPKLIVPDYLLPIIDRHLNKREANIRALNDYDRALNKYCTPQYVHGTKHTKTEFVENGGTIVVQVTETSIDDVLNWEGEALRPKWQVRVHRDSGNKTRGLRLTHIRGCCYQIGNPGSLGPYWAMHSHAWQVLKH